MKHILSILMVLLIAGFCTALGQTAGVSPVMTSAAESDSDLVKTPPPVIDMYGMYCISISHPYSSDIYYRYQIDDFEWTEWRHFDDSFLQFLGMDTYRVEAYAVAEGEIESDVVYIAFTEDDLETGTPIIKAIAGDQYYTVVIANTDECP